MTGSTYYDALETRSTDEREAALLAALPAQIAHAQRSTSAFAQILQGVDAASITTREALAQLPVTRKYEVLEMQRQAICNGQGRGHATFGGFNAQPFGPNMPRVFSSPGPLYEPEGRAVDYWRMARALYAAGFRRGELIHNCFSYHFVPAGSMMETGGNALGCTVFPGGTGQTEQQVQAMAELGAAGYTGTPSFLKLILEKAQTLGIPLSALTKALVSGEAFPPSLREWFVQHGVTAYQCYATADLGLIAYETQAREGLVIDEGVIIEIVQPGTGTPVAPGEVGELVVTTLGQDYPLVRFGTGDLSAVLPGLCPTGRTNVRIKGWMGRADQTTKVRGMFVHPGQIAEVARRFPQIGRVRVVVSGSMGQDQMTLLAESSETAPGLTRLLEEAMRDVTKLRAEVQLLAPGSLPADGKIIEDARSYE